MKRLFVSYRRANWAFTYWLVEVLSSLLDAEIFIDYRGIDETDFEHSLLRHLRESDAMLLIVTSNTFEARIHNDDDWVRREIREALGTNKPIVLALVEGQIPPSDLPDDIKPIAGKQGIEIYPRYFKAGVEELAIFLDKATPIKRRVGSALTTVSTPPAITIHRLPILDLPLLDWISIPGGTVALERGWDGHGWDDRVNYAQMPITAFMVAPFFITKYPVTVAQFQVFIDEGGYRESRYWHSLAKRESGSVPSAWNEPTMPRVNINWYEAMAFTRWLGERLDKSVMLPTELQWQRAALGDSGWVYPYGGTFDPLKCNAKPSKIGRATPVDRYLSGASTFGVMDMCGNVAEWCVNEYSRPDSAEVLATGQRSLRGGSWLSHEGNTRAAFRDLSYPDSRDEYCGFRVVYRPE